MEFIRAREVEVRNPVTSRDLRSLSLAFNGRLRSGLGDFPWAIVYYVLGAFRQMRNPDATGLLWPAMDEFFSAYQMLDPVQGSWPITGPGDPEGANVSSPLCLYIWGNEGAGIPSESWRLGEVPLVMPSGRPPASLAEIRTLGKLQRGAVDLATGAVMAPAWTAARSWDVIRPDWQRSPHMSSYGGWLAAPDIQSPACEDPDEFDEFPAPPNYAIRFTATASGQAAGYTDKVYAGTCQIGVSTTEDYSAHIFTVVNAPWAWYVVLNSGQVDFLPKFAYVEGPYHGLPRLRKTEGGQLARILQSFAAEFRGVEQNATAASALHSGVALKPSTWLDGAFEAQQFLTRQYVLSPARGRQVTGGIEALYPRWRIDTPSDNLAINAGTVILTYPGLKASHKIADGCAAPGGWVEASSLAGALTVEFAAGSRILARVVLTPEEPQAVVPFNLDAEAGENISVRLASIARFTDSSGRIESEVDELVAYKPDMSDWFLVHRLSSGE